MNKYNILLVGPIGTGKTFSLHTVLNIPGIDKLYIQSVEPGITTTIRQWEKRGIDTSRVFYNYVPPAKVDWDVLKINAKLTNSLTMQDLQGRPSPSRSQFTQFLDVVSSLSNFIDQHGEEHGPADEFESNCFLALDGLSGLSRMSRQLVVGAKPIMTQPEWGVAQQNLLQLISKLTDDTKCSFVLISHAERKDDLITGGTHITISTLGQKLAPEIIKPFDEVILTRREEGNFFWSTVDNNADLKTRSLEYKDDIDPDFAKFFEGDE